MNSTTINRRGGRRAVAAALLLCCAAVDATPAIRSTPGNKEKHMASSALDHYTQDLVLGQVWQRPGLSPRDRSIVTVSSLVAGGQVAQVTYHLNRAMDNGLTEAQASEALTQLAFYAGWPNVFSAMPVFKEVFAKRHTQ
jgi:4-carboxymuconolactone decarboxylase